MAKMKDFSISVMPDEVMFTSINTSKDGYNSVRMVVKKGDSEFMSISYEWEGNSIPSFAMDLMGFMKNNNVETSSVWPDKQRDYAEWASKGLPKQEEACDTCEKHNSKKAAKGMCPDCGKKMEECKCKKEDSEEQEDD